MDDLDTHTHVLEPTTKSYATRHRRIAVAKNCSILVEIDPRAPHMVCVYYYMHISLHFTSLHFMDDVRCVL